MLQDIALLIVFLPLFFLNVLAPLLILKTQRLPARVKFAPVPEEDFLRARGAVFNRQDAELKRMGFVYCGSSMMKDTHTETFFSLYSLPGETSGAMLVTINSPVKNMTYLEFWQRFANGVFLDVNNADVVSVYPAMKQKMMLRYPDVNEPAALLAIFNRIRAAAQKNAQPLEWDPAQGFKLVEDALARESDELVRLGFCHEDVDEQGKRRLTLKGAYRLTWKNVFPGKGIQMLLDNRLAQRALRKA